MFHKDTFRLIKKTAKRFATILLIVMIGVGFMVGLMCSAPTMRVSVDKYFDDYNLMDVQLYSSYGFDDRDVTALKKSNLVDDIYPTKFIDAFVNSGEHTYITRVQELDSDINKTQLLEGRMPNKAGEALALGSASFGTVFQIGDEISLYLEDSELSESLAVTDYEIVGIVRTPQYMASSKETSTLNNLTLSTVVYVDKDNFINDYYTSLYLTFKDAKYYDSFSDEYKDFITENLDDMKKIIREREVVRRDEVLEEVTQEIADGEKELEEEIADAQKKIDDGKKELEDGYIQLLVGEAQLEASEKQITEGEKEIAANEKLLADSEKQIKDAKKAIEDETGMTFAEASGAIKGAYGMYVMAEMMLENEDYNPEKSINQQIADLNTEIDTLTAENSTFTQENTRLQVENRTLEGENDRLNGENSALQQANKDLEEQNKLLDAEGKTEEIAANNLLIAANVATIEANNRQIETNETQITANTAKITENNEKTSANRTRISERRQEILELETLRGFVGDAVLKEIPPMIDEMFGGDAKAAYDGIIQLEDGEKQLESGKTQIASAKKEIETGKSQLLSAKAELADGRAEYEKGKKELEDAQKELDEEYEKARIDLDKARQELEELPDAKWTVLDRDSHYSTLMFSGNADQMWRIGLVFPMLFFLVAALVCMTTMKRLVDEERSQIGVFSALGFSKGKIISKYVIYALSASLLGSIVGIPIGMGLYPTVIYYCWKMMYDLPDMLLTMPASITIVGICSFTLLMMGVTVIVVRAVLKEEPSQLMRPKAPRKAKKIFLEYIPFVWKRLSFTSKVTARNIIRYKSRFFMTVIGVAGCTSLLVLGFAIKGSIAQVISLQFEDVISYNTTITLENKDYTEDIHTQLLDDKNVDSAVPYMSYSTMAYMEDENKAIQVYILAEDDMPYAFDLRDRRSKETLEPDDGVVISEKFAKLHDLSVGDEITMESSNGIKKPVEITGICEMYTQHYLFITEETYEYIFNETVEYDNLAITATDSADVIEKYEDKEGIETISDFAGTIATFTDMLGTLDIIVVVIIIAAGSLALVVIINLTEVNISERIREIATLKVLGFNNGEVNSYIFKEVFILSLIGMIFGLPLGKLELTYVMGIIEMEMVMFSTVIEPMSYILGFVITLVFTILVIFLMRKSLQKVEMVESLKSVE